MQVGEEEVNWDIFHVKRLLIAWSQACGDLLKLEIVFGVDRINQFIEVFGRAGAVHNDAILARLLVGPQSAHHVHVDHGDGVGERQQRLPTIVRRSE